MYGVILHRIKHNTLSPTKRVVLDRLTTIKCITKVQDGVYTTFLESGEEYLRIELLEVIV
jgi:hypothetical protein